MSNNEADRLAALKALFKDAMDWGRSYGQRLNLSDITVDDVSEQYAEKALAALAKQQAPEATAEQSAWHAGLDEGRAQKAEATQAAAQAEQRAALQELADMHQEMGAYGATGGVQISDARIEEIYRRFGTGTPGGFGAAVRAILAEAGIKEKP